MSTKLPEEPVVVTGVKGEHNPSRPSRHWLTYHAQALSLRAWRFAFQRRDSKSDCSYYAIAGIHGRPYTAYNGVEGRHLVGREVNIDGSANVGGYCAHTSIVFTTWHRPFLALFEYNWHADANTRGYHTLAIDRLGQGADTAHPDPLNIVQAQLHVEIIHQLITAIRKNAKNNALGQGFNKIVYVGHSFGSILGTAVGRQYPADADVTVLTGYSSTPNLGAISGYQLASAALFRPQQFTGYPLGYTIMPVEAERRANFFEGAYDPALAHFDYLTQRAFTTAYDFFAPDNTGHALFLHYSAPETLRQVHDFLDRHI
ncbi:hypothetical protein B0T24DRAFT_701698 [Lasiosphaeria ovina]|uniref:Tyrosinase copper-binding domain-containing protein n=1 Tax=Lasiosphaeria ovina TaxID=92902 RepID=A0AAE0KIT7_9PEZI|nr:hypothetical protein B0T24DRAFT_701698 [Lasiosphaeria ovina]